MTDAEQLMRGYVQLLRESPFRIVPERAEELMGRMGGSAWFLDVGEGPANFTAFPETKEIQGTYAALLSIWAVAASVHVLLMVTQTAASKGIEQVVIESNRPGAIAIELKNAALALIRDPTSPWSDCLPHPDPSADPSSEVGLTNNLFLAAASFVVLHECAHIALAHQPYTPLLHHQEREADAWAVLWILDQVPDGKHREFRALAICVAFIWIGLIDEIRRAGSTHPSAAQRLGDAFEGCDGLAEDSMALEIGSYVLKAFFDPTTALPQPDNAADAFIDRLIEYSRRG